MGLGLFQFLGIGVLLEKYAGNPEKLGNSLLIATVLIAVFSYFVGSLNGAKIVSKFVYHDDVSLHGSKNAGMTNMARVYGKKGAVLTTVIDMLKTILCVFVGCYFGNTTFLPYIAGLFCMIGHSFPVYFKFKGGKGILVGASVMLCTSIPTFVLSLLIFGIVVGFTKYVSLGSIMASLMYPFILARMNAVFYTLPGRSDLGEMFAFVMACITIFLHRENIKRLGKGTENKIGKKKKKEDEESGN